ncbi:MAG: DUF547 domain-containing protein [Flavobacterium sp.]|nr:DUF547 domain-containing protein [Flavobacterium sp.]
MKKLIVLFALFSSFAFAQNFNYKSYEVLLKKYVSDKGNVNYDELNRNKAELNVVVAQFEKNSVKKNWSKNEKMAYYINTYNVYTLKSIIDNYPVKSIKDIKDVWDKKIIQMGAEKVSLSYVENKILRKMGDPRIHFAINCASFSCPNLSNNAYEPENLNK